MAVDITKRVSKKVTNLAVTRDGYTIKASWEIPPLMTDESRSDRATFVDAQCYIDHVEAENVEGEVCDTRDGSNIGANDKPITYTGYDRYWIKGLRLNEDFDKPFSRSRYYPVKNDKSYCCKQVLVTVHGGNSSGTTSLDPQFRDSFGRGPLTKATYAFSVPRRPEVTISYNSSNSTATVTIVTDAGTDNQERYDTMVRLTVKQQDGTSVVTRNWTAIQDTEKSYSVDLSSYLASITAGKYVTLTAEAYARGMAGDSPTTTAYRSVGKPGMGTIKSITVDKKAAGGTIKVEVDASWLASQVQLQRRHGSTGTWANVANAVDDADVEALYDTYTDAAPVDGEYIYYRIVSTRDQFTTDSAAKKAIALFTAKAKTVCTSSVGIVSTASSKAGTSATVGIGFTDAETYTSSQMATELSWSTSRNAWNSTTGPSTTTISGNGSASTGDFERTQSKTISSLTAGTTYYVRARRVRTVGTEVVYSKYSPIASFMTESASDDTCGIIETSTAFQGTGSRNGMRVTVTVGFNEDNQNTGTEISWADHKDAWQSNEQPEQLLATWARTAMPSGSDWAYKQTSYIRGLLPNTTYWIKARRYLVSSGSTTYGAWSKLGSFTTPSEKSEAQLRCGIPTAAMDDGGTGIKVVVGWAGNRTGNEVSWSDDENAWESDKQPSTMTLEWEDETPASNAWAHTATAYISNTKPGKTYYIRARTYLDGEQRQWSDYSATKSVTPYTAPDSVTLTAPSAVPRGKGIECWWTISGDLDQKQWAIHKDGYPNTALRSGMNSLCRTVIPASRYGSSDTISFYVAAGCGGALTSSNVVSVGIADKPSCAVSMASATVTAQPVSFTVTTDNPEASVLCTCKSDGITQEMPYGPRDQIAGDVVWTSLVKPSWTSSNGSYTATITMPSDIDLVDGGGYDISAKTVEPVGNLASDQEHVAFEVDWAHKAQKPSSSITLTPNAASRYVTITLAAPAGAAQTDVYDIYRKTPTGYDLIAADLALTTSVLDQYAPFGTDADLYYRICSRTADGDIEFWDYPYTMAVDVLRFDWPGGSVELPYNIDVHEGWAKSFETREHVDGSVSGYWDRAVKMTGHYTTDTIRFDDLSTYEAVNHLGEYPGAVFCRTPSGMAFQCDAQPRDLGMSYKSAMLQSRVDVTKVDLTDDFTVKNGRGL